LAAGAGYFKPHDLRRTCATGVSRLSNPIVASKILGHTATPGVPSVTAIYDRYDRLPEKAAALTGWGAFIERLLSGESRDRVVPLARADAGKTV
jgi:integrase